MHVIPAVGGRGGFNDAACYKLLNIPEHNKYKSLTSDVKGDKRTGAQTATVGHVGALFTAAVHKDPNLAGRRGL